LLFTNYASVSESAQCTERYVEMMVMVMTMVLITSGQSNLTAGRIAVAHGRFSGIGEYD